MKFADPLIMISFDIEEFDVPQERGREISFEAQMEVSRVGTESILSVLESHPTVRATFYVTGRFAEQCPDLLERMKRVGEIASHGYNHSEFTLSDLEKARKVLSALSGVPVLGFRMPRMADVPRSALVAAGYHYDSSSNPTWIPGRYNAFDQPPSPFDDPCGLFEVPASVTPCVRFPLFWLSFKNLPLTLFVRLAVWTLRRRKFLNLYWHPWEFNAAIQDPAYAIPSFMTRDAGHRLTAKLDRFLTAITPFGTFVTTAEYAARFHQKETVKNEPFR